MTIYANGAAVTSPVRSRAFRGEEDFWRVRNLLIETYPITPPEFNWEIRRWDGNHFHLAHVGWQHEDCARIRLWETESGHLVGAAHPEGNRDAFLELHPDYRHLIEEEMLAWVEANLGAVNAESGRRRVTTFAHEYNIPRRRLLQRRGWQKTESGGKIRRLRFGGRPVPEASLPAGYTLRTTWPEDGAECGRMAAVLNAGFNRTIHTAGEYENFSTRSPSFRHDLNLVAVAPDGSFASHVGVTYIAENRYGVFEPVCTHPEHRRRGLARNLMFEGLRRLRALGAADAYVGSGDAVAANELYDSVGFTEAYAGYDWFKEF